MQIDYTADAFASLAQLVNFIEEKNTAGAGLRWLSRYEKYLQDALSDSKPKRTCSNNTFKKLNLICIYYNDWIIAFSIP